MPAGLKYISLLQCDEDVGLRKCVAKMGRGMHLSMLGSVDEFLDLLGPHEGVLIVNLAGSCEAQACWT